VVLGLGFRFSCLNLNLLQVYRNVAEQDRWPTDVGGTSGVSIDDLPTKKLDAWQLWVK